MSLDLIKVNKVSKKFGNKEVLKDVNLTIKQGESVALLGHNGSGKSTLLRIICGLTSTDSGEVKYSHKLKFNYVPENFPKMDITARKYVKLTGLIEGIVEKELEEKSKELYKAFFLESMVDSPMKHLSKGTLQKIGVIQALLTKPDVLLLDEPLSGQDLESQKLFIKLINKLNKQGVTIIMSCHERFLVNVVSNEAYEISNMKINKIEIDETCKNEYDVVIFLKPEENSSIPVNISNLIDKIENENSRVRLVVEREKSNEVIKNMLEEGYILRGMFSE